MFDFDKKYPFEERLAEAKKMLDKYPNRIPVIVEKAKNVRSDTPDIDKTKYLVPDDLTWGQFVWIIRKRIKLAPEQGLFIFVNNIQPGSAALMRSVYEEYKDKSLFLYATYTLESTFGS